MGFSERAKGRFRIPSQAESEFLTGVVHAQQAVLPAVRSGGEAYADRGRKEEAIRSYKRSLELNPENKSAKAALERLVPPAKKDPA